MAGTHNNLLNKRREMRKTFESFEWLIKDDLRRLDRRTRKMQQEVIAVGARRADIEAYVHEQFVRLWNEVASEQNEIEAKEESA